MSARIRTSVAARLAVLAALMGTTAAAATHVSTVDVAPAATALRSLPLVVDDWRGKERPALSADEAAVLGVSEYIDRTYRRDGTVVGLYVGYYASQRQGDAVHSPMNCLPGTGWAPVETGYSRLSLARVDGRRAPITVRRLRVQRSGDEALVLYWYQSRGRVIASDYWSKAYLMLDAMRLNRTDTALVRVFSMIDRGEGGASRAGADLSAFVSAVMPHLERHLPE